MYACAARRHGENSAARPLARSACTANAVSHSCDPLYPCAAAAAERVERVRTRIEQFSSDRASARRARLHLHAVLGDPEVVGDARDVAAERLAVGAALEPAAQHVDHLVHGPDVDVPARERYARLSRVCARAARAHRRLTEPRAACFRPRSGCAPSRGAAPRAAPRYPAAAARRRGAASTTPRPAQAPRLFEHCSRGGFKRVRSRSRLQRGVRVVQVLLGAGGARGVPVDALVRLAEQLAAQRRRQRRGGARAAHAVHVAHRQVHHAAVAPAAAAVSRGRSAAGRAAVARTTCGRGAPAARTAGATSRAASG